jgi:hypothetical protein
MKKLINWLTDYIEFFFKNYEDDVTFIQRTLHEQQKKG